MKSIILASRKLAVFLAVLPPPPRLPKNVMLIIGGCATLIAMWPLAVRAAECIGLPSSNLSVTIFHRVTRTVIVNAEVLDRVAGEMQSSQFRLQAHPLMLAVSELAADIAVDHRSVKVDEDTFCAAPRSVRVTIGFPERSVYIDRSVEENSCVRKELVSHDEEHARADDNALLTLLTKIEDPLVKTLSVLKQRPAVTAAIAEQEFQAGLDAFLRDAVAAFAEERDRLQKQVDAPAEMERLRGACGGSVKRLEQQGRSRGT